MWAQKSPPEGDAGLSNASTQGQFSRREKRPGQGEPPNPGSSTFSHWEFQGPAWQWARRGTQEKAGTLGSRKKV